jgi:hypothetical protein
VYFEDSVGSNLYSLDSVLLISYAIFFQPKASSSSASTASKAPVSQVIFGKFEYCT